MIKNGLKRLLPFVMLLCFVFLTLFAPSTAAVSDPFRLSVSAKSLTETKSDEAESAACGFLPVKASRLPEEARKELICGGELFGVRMELGGLLITELGDVETENGSVSPGEAAGLQKGDVLTEADGAPLSSAADLVKIVSRSEGKTVTLKRLRQGESQTVTLRPALSADGGGYKAGLWVRDGAAGIGTVTYLDPETGAFAGLGHAVCDSAGGAVFPMKSGTVCEALPEGIRKGENGSPGELRGRLDKAEIGSVSANTRTGIYGTMPPSKAEGQKAVPIAFKDEVTKGKATILCTLDKSGKKEYEIEIEEIIDRDRQSKNLILHVTDPALLEQTGGIIQGMSGSPVIQNGKLVGAVTHVLVNDPTRGYGIFIENMLNAAE